MKRLEIVPTFTAQLGGKILPNAHAVVDVDGDDLHDLVFGCTDGTVAAYKISPTRLMKWQECRVNGCVSAICADPNMPNDMRIFVATADGSCFVIQATESGDDFFPSAEFRVALNVSDITLHRGFLVFGTRDGDVLVFKHDPNAFGGYCQIRTFELGFEIEAFVTLASDPSAVQLIVRCTTGEIFELQLTEEGDVAKSQWRAPSQALLDGAVSYFVDAVRVPDEGDDCIACGSLAGRIEVLTQNGDHVWDYELPEAVMGMDRIEVASGVDSIVACTWGGGFYLIRDPDQIAHFRMVQPASSMFCADVAMAASTKAERVLVATSTSGMISIYLGLDEALTHALDRKSVMSVVEGSAVASQVDSDDKRRAILKKLLEKTDQSQSSELSRVLSQTSVDMKDLVQLATTQRW